MKADEVKARFMDGSFVIFNVFSITVAQRTREFGMLRTLGANRGQILRTVLIEGFLIGLFASVIGILTGLGLAKGLSAILSAVGADLPTKALVVEPRTIIVSLIIGIGVTLVSSLIPSRTTDNARPGSRRSPHSPRTSFSRARTASWCGASSRPCSRSSGSG